MNRIKKKKRLKLEYFFILLLIPWINVRGQSNGYDDIDNLRKTIPQFLSPQIASIVRNDFTPVAMNSGRIDLQIPLLYNYSDRDFNFPISISYNSSGFKPAEIEGSVGLNWSLLSGGIIYREVRGIPDDMDEYMYNDLTKDLKVKGFLHLAKNKSLPSYMKDSIFNNPSKFAPLDNIYNIPLIKAGSNFVEASSDIYRFNFLGHSGKFVIDFDGSIKDVSYSGGKIKVDISGYQFTSRNSPNSNSEIKIITDDGFVYCFGGSYDAMEYSVYSWLAYDDPMKKWDPTNYRNTANAFHLYKIIAPNGRVLEIKYHELADNTYHSYPERLFSLVPVNTVFQKLKMNYLFRGSIAGYGNTWYNSYSLIKTALIKEVVLDDKIIKFYHSPRTETIFTKESLDDPYTEFGSCCGAQLDSICLYSKISDQLLKIESSVLSYNFKNRYFLTKVSNTKIGSYSFTYNALENISPFTIDIDHWNFWNGTRSNKRLIPEYDFDKVTGDMILPRYISSDRKSNGDCSVALLNKVTYPTGGFTTFEYEPHTYSFILNRTSNSYYLPSMVSANSSSERAGGARIKEITHFDQNGGCQSKRYVYSEKPLSLKDGERSSGELMYMPIYVAFTVYNSSGAPIMLLSTKSSSGINYPPYDRDHVRYYSVLEYDYYKQTNYWKPDSTYFIELNSLSEAGMLVDTIYTGSLEQRWDIEGSGDGRLGYPEDNWGQVEIGYRNFSFIGSKYHPQQLTNWNQGFKGTPFKAIPGPNGTEEVPGLDLDKNTYYPIKVKKNGSGSARLNIKYLGTGSNYTVVEGIYKKTSFTRYGRTINNEHPDDYDDDDKRIYSVLNNLIIPNWNLIRFYKSFSKIAKDRSVERGKLLKEEYFDINGKCIKEVEYNYRKDLEDAKKNYSVFIHRPVNLQNSQFGFYSYATKEYFYPYYLESKTITENDIFTTREKYRMDNTGNYLREKSLGSSTGEDVIATYTYPFDYEQKGIYKLMVDRNMLFPIESIRYKNTVKKETELSRQKNNYQELQSGILPQSIISSSGKELSTVVIFNRYDKRGNILELTKSDNTKTIYIWSYNYQYPVAEIQNATYVQVESAVAAIGLGTIDNLSQSVSPDKAKLDALRTKLPDALVTTYTYEPLVGMVSMTDPRGITTYYEYDSSGRLKNLKDNEKHLVELYQYNYVNKTEGGNEPGGNEPGGNEPGGNEPGGNEPGGNEPGGNEPVKTFSLKFSDIIYNNKGDYGKTLTANIYCKENVTILLTYDFKINSPHSGTNEQVSFSVGTFSEHLLEDSREEGVKIHLSAGNNKVYIEAYKGDRNKGSGSVSISIDKVISENADKWNISSPSSLTFSY